MYHPEWVEITLVNLHSQNIVPLKVDTKMSWFFFGIYRFDSRHLKFGRKKLRVGTDGTGTTKVHQMVLPRNLARPGPGRPGHVKIAIVITAVDWSIFCFCSSSTSLLSNDNIWQTQPVATLLCVLKGQKLAPFNLGWRLALRIFLDRNRCIKSTK